MDQLQITPNDSVAIVESIGFMAAARLVQLISQETRVRVVAVTPMNAAGAITTVLAGPLAEVQYALQIAKSGNAVSDSTFFARPNIETIEMLLRSAFGNAAPARVQQKAKQPEPLPLFEVPASPEAREPARQQRPTLQAVSSNGASQPSANAQSFEMKPLYELESYPVHELRRYARSIPGFPIQGREISKANRAELLQLIKTTEERTRTQAARDAASGEPAHDELVSNVNSN